MLKLPPVGSVVEIEWEDISLSDDWNIFDEAMADADQLSCCRNLGCLYKVTRKVIYLVSSVGQDEHGNMTKNGCMYRIPRSVIRKVKVLRKERG